MRKNSKIRVEQVLSISAVVVASAIFASPVFFTAVALASKL